ncbi:TetR/AcrR family transcriptional regulator [Nocardioides sp. SYSU D00038]|uniref:TetR/AcrR family transcriptional regulator n=1 Tax=Nocardioides sp. SYSU D00038 TaxID=2812554 RepID=UPI0027DCE694|nr:TetR/AcrR family transcriptional regulator [Nocardioides sp. SYSU D00038]
MARRGYDMGARAAAQERTREAILDAAVQLFDGAWYDQVTLADVARRAGVSQQTVVNHFGSKIGLYLAGVAERFAPLVRADRARAVPGDVASVVETVVRDYERTGDSTWRTVALVEREPALRELFEGGRRAHREFVEEVFAPQLAGRRGARRERLVQLLATTLEVGTWHSLRRDAGLDQETTASHLRALVEAVLAAG